MSKANNYYAHEEKAIKILGRDTVDEMDTMDSEQLKKVIVDASSAMKEVKEELEANAEYQRAKSDLKHLSEGKREVDKRQKSRINYALSLMTRNAEMTPEDRHAWLQRTQEYAQKQLKKLEKSE